MLIENSCSRLHYRYLYFISKSSGKEALVNPKTVKSIFKTCTNPIHKYDIISLEIFVPIYEFN